MSQNTTIKASTINKKSPTTSNSNNQSFQTSSAASNNVLISLLLIPIGIILYYSIQLNQISNQQQLVINNVLDLLKNQSTISSKSMFLEQNFNQKPLAWVTGDNMQVGYLQHVIDVFQKIGFQVWTEKQPPPVEQYGDWLVLWTHEYPFTPKFNLPELKPYQKINHFPGTGYITNKVNLATSNLKHIPKAFYLPKEKEEFLKFAEQNPEMLWVQKDNTHRGIKVKSIKELDLDRKGTFVQEFIQNPLLIDNKKFDIGLYVTMTSLNPLRLYIFDNEALLRFCAKPYPPSKQEFNSSDLDSYVVGDQYTPIWQIPSLAKYYSELNMNMKQSFNSYIKLELNSDPQPIWDAMEESIKTIFYVKQEEMLQIASVYPNMRNFFEMVRFDFTLDDQLNVYLMEANMSPNLASAKYPPNRLIYEQVIYNVFSLVGITNLPQFFGKTWSQKPKQLWNMLINDKDLSILPDICSQDNCLLSKNSSSCLIEQCDCCYHCLSEEMKLILKDAYLEELFKLNQRRLIPSTSKESPILSNSHFNYLQDKWFIGKCLLEDKWCN